MRMNRIPAPVADPPPSRPQLPKLLDETGAAEVLGISIRTLQSWRVRGSGPAFRKVGRLVRYSTADLTAWLDAGVRNQTAGA